MAVITPTSRHIEFAPFIEQSIFTVAEIHAAETIVDAVFRDVGETPLFLDYLSIAIAVWAPNNGHVCANLRNIHERVLEDNGSEEELESQNAIDWPNVDVWLEHLNSSILVGRPSSNHDIDLKRPLVLNGSSLYLTRQWIDEGDVAERLRTRLLRQKSPLPEGAQSWIDAVFSQDTSGLQKDAVRRALTHNTSVLLGGPGTGKTFTIAGMLHAFFSEHNLKTMAETRPLRVALAAPTAKAAKQIANSIEDSLKNSAFPNTFSNELTRISTEASTIHRLLGWSRGNRGRFKHNRQNVLPFDVVIIDEVSMVSLPLAARLLEALAPETKLVLVGDPEQLKSVEAGAVLPEISKLDPVRGFPITTLTRNVRQAANGKTNPIGDLAEMIRQIRDESTTSIDAVVSFLRQNHDEIVWIEPSSATGNDFAPTKIQKHIAPYLDGYKKALEFAKLGDGKGALGELAKVRVLCGHRIGLFGVREWNNSVADLIGVGRARGSIGQPLLNTRNNMKTGLVNGDTGIVIKDGKSARAVFSVVAHVSDADGGTDGNSFTLQMFEPTALEDVETSFAMTVHKAQGSQFGTTIFVVPPVGSRLLVREMFYTAITRAMQKLVIIGSEAAIREAINRRIARESCLAERIQQG